MTDLIRALGLMSGTSMDGIDIALVETDGEGIVKRGPALMLAYEPAFRARLKQGLEEAKSITTRHERPGSLAELERDQTLLHAEAVRQFLRRHGLRPRDIDLIGFHGQTVLHRPDQALTVQIGDGNLLARTLGVPVIYDMRAHDMERGGQGAPLIPAYHAALAAGLGEEAFPVCFVNIGGISNLTYIGRDGEIVAFDSGPGNSLIDQWVEALTGKPYDSEGQIAANGRLVPALADHYLSQPFFTSNSRRSLDRNDFLPPKPNAASLEDGARTLAHVTAAAIFASGRHLPQKPKTYVICGGGRLNRVIMADLRHMAEKQGATLLSADDMGLDGDAMEAEAWAYLAVRSQKSLPLTFPGTTGVAQPVTGGVLARPVILETERLILLPWERDDARLIASLHDSERTSRFVSTRKPWSLDYASHRMQGWLDEFETDGTGKMKILNKADGRFIGRAGFSRSKEHGSGYELGYSIAEKEWGKGFATEIARGLSRWFFETQRGDHFIAFAHVDNAASLAVLRKIATKDLGVAEHKGDPFHFFETVRTSIAENDF